MVPTVLIQPASAKAYATPIWPLIADCYRLATSATEQELASFFFVVPSDTDTRLATITLYKNERPLSPGHSNLADVTDLRTGRYTLRTNALLFAASDDSDPRTNGRRYTFEI